MFVQIAKEFLTHQGQRPAKGEDAAFECAVLALGTPTVMAKANVLRFRLTETVPAAHTFPSSVSTPTSTAVLEQVRRRQITGMTTI